MRTPRLILLAITSLCAVLALPAAAPAAKTKKQTCKTAKDLRTTRCLYGSKWDIHSADWTQKQTIDYTDEDKTFAGGGTAQLDALDVAGKPLVFPSPKEPVEPWTQVGIVDFKAVSTGSWMFSDGRSQDCSWKAPDSATPPGFGGIAALKGKVLSIQYGLAGVAFACEEGLPSGLESFGVTIQEYSLSRFRGKKRVTLPIRVRMTINDDGLRATNSFDGSFTLERLK